jgi:hypothetical protein
MNNEYQSIMAWRNGVINNQCINNVAIMSIINNGVMSNENNRNQWRNGVSVIM